MKKIKGFTLIEFIIALTIGAIIIMGTGFILANGKKNQIIQIQKEAMQRDATDLGNLLGRYTRNLGNIMCMQYAVDGLALDFLNKSFFQSRLNGTDIIYRFKMRKSFVTQENAAKVSSSVVDYAGLDSPFVFTSNCIDSITSVSDISDIVGQESYAFDEVELYHDKTRNQLRILDGAKSRVFFENVTSFQVFYAARLADTTNRDPDGQWHLIAGAEAPDIVALKFKFTLHQSSQNPATSIDKKTYETVVAVRNLTL